MGNYKSKLMDAYQRMDKLFHENKLWNEDTIGGALSIVVHTTIIWEKFGRLCVLLVDYYGTEIRGLVIQFILIVWWMSFYILKTDQYPF